MSANARLCISALLQSETAPSGSIAYFWEGWPRQIPANVEVIPASDVKLAYLNDFHPASTVYQTAYAVSSGSRFWWDIAMPVLRLQGKRLIWNQNGLYYPAWGASKWRMLNARLAYFMLLADGIVFQSEFCRRATARLVPFSDFILEKPFRVLLNPVDTGRFRPRSEEGRRPIILCRFSNERGRRYRNILAFETLLELRRFVPDARLLFLGAKECPEAKRIREMLRSAARLGRLPTDSIEFQPQFSRNEAPAVFRMGTLWLHTAYCDPCPNIVGEAMASGLPVVYLANGGTGEIVGSGGVGVPCEENFAKMTVPSPERMAQAIVRVLEDYASLSARARWEAESRLDVSDYARQTLRFARELSEG